MKVNRLTSYAQIPRKATPGVVGCDLYSAYKTIVPGGGRALIKIDISIEIPPGTYARIAPRSSLALKNFIQVGVGVVDEDYRGPVGVLLFNHPREPFVVNRGDRIAQLILERIANPEVVEVEVLEETERGAGGLGSIGKHDIPDRNFQKTVDAM